MIHELSDIFHSDIRKTFDMQRWFNNLVVIDYALFVITLLFDIELYVVLLVFGHRFNMIKFKLIVAKTLS